MKIPPRISIDRFEKIVALYSTGLEISEIARRVYLSISAIKNMLYLYAPEILQERREKKARERAEFVSAVLSLYQSGESIAEICRSLKSNRDTVRRVINASEDRRKDSIRYKAIMAYVEGQSIEEVAEENGVMPLTIKRWLKAYRQTPRHLGMLMRARRDNAIIKEYQEGCLVETICARHQIQYCQLYNILKKHNVKLNRKPRKNDATA